MKTNPCICETHIEFEYGWCFTCGRSLAWSLDFTHEEVNWGLLRLGMAVDSMRLKIRQEARDEGIDTNDHDAYRSWLMARQEARKQGGSVPHKGRRCKSGRPAVAPVGPRLLGMDRRTPPCPLMDAVRRRQGHVRRDRSHGAYGWGIGRARPILLMSPLCHGFVDRTKISV
jgi:hypothetical protein